MKCPYSLPGPVVIYVQAPILLALATLPLLEEVHPLSSIHLIWDHQLPSLLYNSHHLKKNKAKKQVSVILNLLNYYSICCWCCSLNGKVLKKLLLIVHPGSALSAADLSLNLQHWNHSCQCQASVMTHFITAFVFSSYSPYPQCLAHLIITHIPVTGSWHPWSKLLVFVLLHKLLLVSYSGFRISRWNPNI